MAYTCENCGAKPVVVGDCCYCPNCDRDAVGRAREREQPASRAATKAEISGECMNLIAEGVREYAENDPVEINRREQNGGRITVDATNEGGHNGTSIDLEDLLAWVSREMPELYSRFMPRA